MADGRTVQVGAGRVASGVAIVLAVTLFGGPAWADKCRRQEARLAAAMTMLNKLAERTTRVAVACHFRGPDDAAVRRVRKDAVATYRAFMKAAPETTPDCTRRNPEVTLGSVSRWVGDRIGAVYGLCSSDAENIVELGYAEEERIKRLQPSVERFIKGILEEAGLGSAVR